MRHTRAHTGNRRSHHAVTSPKTSACASCKAPKMPHVMCGVCGKYNGRTVVDTVAKIAKKEARKKALAKKG